MAFASTAFAASAFQMEGDITAASAIYGSPTYLWAAKIPVRGVTARTDKIDIAAAFETVRVSDGLVAPPKPAKAKGIKVNYQ
jgi:hypothetical protein